MKHCGKKKTNPVSCTDWYNNCLFTVKQTQLACLGTYLLFFFFFPFVVVLRVQNLVVTLNISSQMFYFITAVGRVTPLRKITETWQHVGFIQQWLKVRQLKKKLTTGYHAMFSSGTRGSQPWYFHLLCVRLIQKKRGKRTGFFFWELIFTLFSQVQHDVLFLEICHVFEKVFFCISVR